MIQLYKEIKRVVLDIVHSAFPHYLNQRVIKLITEVSLVLDSAYIKDHDQIPTYTIVTLLKPTSKVQILLLENTDYNFEKSGQKSPPKMITICDHFSNNCFFYFFFTCFVDMFLVTEIVF